MAGGIWSTTEKSVLPGLYMNFQAAAASAVQPGSRGTVAVLVKGNWGPERQFVEIGSTAAIGLIYSNDGEGGATAYNSLHLALLGGPKKLLAYRVADSAASKAELTLKSGSADALRLTAAYTGSRGNAFRVAVQPGVTDAATLELRLYEGAKLLRTFVSADGSAAALAEAVNADPDNLWITAEALAAESKPSPVSGEAFEGGASGSGELTNEEYIAAQTALEGTDFDVLALDFAADSALLQSFAGFIKRLRSEGRGVTLVVGGTKADDTSSKAAEIAAARSAALNHEGIVNVGTGVKLSEISYSSAQTSAYVAGLIAGQRLNESTTYHAAPFDDVTRRWTRSEQESAVKNGVFILFHDGRQVKTLRGINTLVTPGAGQNSAWKKIRSVRVMDAISSDLQRTAEDSYIGKVNNTEEGRLALIGAMKEYLTLLAQSGVIEADGFNVVLDPAYYGSAPILKPEADQVFLQWNVKLADVMEQLFGTFYVQ
ncbi:phage tail sheath family protein [Saccharibacillus sp. CPCC 101409]|uniref:phage tail sheath family protein n=1 Tax=Saccharibacillus sp. CPCC 101409 TaxID=3058041 RepID=UPI0026719544|nr:phage tail sheath family protein [Saccharibacillus sp. CPCC 101409]MDO3408547.1 phage tail sheath family protein [Saccharibacillus sp. CPCC 101409]